MSIPKPKEHLSLHTVAVNKKFTFCVYDHSTVGITLCRIALSHRAISTVGSAFSSDYIYRTSTAFPPFTGYCYNMVSRNRPRKNGSSKKVSEIKIGS